MLEHAVIVWAVVLGAVGLFAATGLLFYRHHLRRALRGASAWQRRLAVALLVCLVLLGGLMAWPGIRTQDGRSGGNVPKRTPGSAADGAKTLESASQHIVYVLDCSGSMVARFDRVRSETCRHAGDLDTSSSFHVILFVNGDIVEGPAGGPRLATVEHKVALAGFMAEMRPLGSASPSDALKRAFEQLADLTGQKRICLVTEGRGLLEDVKGTRAAIEEGNKNGDVQVYVLIHGPISPEARQLAVGIAKDTGGRFRNVSDDDD